MRALRHAAGAARSSGGAREPGGGRSRTGGGTAEHRPGHESLADDAAARPVRHDAGPARPQDARRRRPARRDAGGRPVQCPLRAAHRPAAARPAAARHQLGAGAPLQRRERPRHLRRDQRRVALRAVRAARQAGPGAAGGAGAWPLRAGSAGDGDAGLRHAIGHRAARTGTGCAVRADVGRGAGAAARHPAAAGRDRDGARDGDSPGAAGRRGRLRLGTDEAGRPRPAGIGADLPADGATYPFGAHDTMGDERLDPYAHLQSDLVGQISPTVGPQ